MRSYLTKRWGDIEVVYTKTTDGGGRTFARDYLDLFRQCGLNLAYDRILEWCAGPGFIGYSLLAAGLGKTLYLTDCYGPAITAARLTAQINGLSDRVTIMQGDGIVPLSQQNARFDLIVGNPPHYDGRNMLEYQYGLPPRIYVDEAWRLHRQFFGAIARYLTREGLIILLENSTGSHPETFRGMIDEGGLTLLGWRWTQRTRGYWFMFVARKDGVFDPDSAAGRLLLGASRGQRLKQ